jgi:hypothetical protein
VISLDPAKLMTERLAQKKARDQRLVGALDLVQRYPGPWWNEPPGPTTSFDAENSSFEYVSFAMSQLVWANPRWRVSTRRPRAQEMVAEAIGFGMNRWTVDGDMKTTLEDLAVDYSFCWGVGHVTPVRRPETYEAEDPAMWPQFSRISPSDFGFDQRCPNWRRARMLWHDYRIDKEDLVEVAKRDRELPRDQREGWNLEAVRNLQETSDAERNLARANAWGRGIYEDAPDRDQVTLTSVYLPTTKLPNKPGPEEGFNGTVVTLGTGGDGDRTAVEVQKARPFYGPRWGPYTVFGCYIVPDSPFPLAALVASGGHIEQASRLSKAVDNQVEAYKRLLLVGAQDPQLAQNLKSGKNDHVYFARQIQDIDRLVRQFEKGGTTVPNLNAEARAINKRNRSLGMDEVQRGNVTGEGTATEVQFAVEASLGRQGYVKGRFQDACRRVGRTTAWYLYHDDRIQFPLGPDAIEAMGLNPETDEAMFEGGEFFDGSGATFDDLGLEIEAYSMERPSEAFLRQRGELLGNVLQLVPALAMLGQAGGDAKGFLDAYGDAYGYPKLSSLFPGIDSVDPSVIQAFQAAPRLGRDSGPVGPARFINGMGGTRGGAGRSNPGANTMKPMQLTAG